MRRTLLHGWILFIPLLYSFQHQLNIPWTPPAPAPEVDTLRFMQSSLRLIPTETLNHIPHRRPVPDDIPSGSPFGLRHHPILDSLMLHTGVDFAAPKGTAVLACADGIVERVKSLSDSSDYGIYVTLNHPARSIEPDSFSSRYAHLSRVFVRPGQHVQAGDTLGWVGSTGRSTAPHLHFEIFQNGVLVDPAYFFPPHERDRNHPLLADNLAQQRF